MRPIRLELEGFTSFRQKAEVDFSSLDLFAITGPTGAGKTSLIDALIYALYGRTPRLGEKGVSELISQGSPRLRVFLEFAAGKKNYRVVRTMKRGGGAVVALETRNDSGAWDAVSNRSIEVRDKVKEIVGLDFDGFTKSVVLPQGEFDRFLRGKADQRREILSELLQLGIYEEMGRRAREKAKCALTEESALEQRLATTYAEATEENRAVREKELEAFERQQQAVGERLKVVADAQPLALELRQQRKTREASEREREITAKNLGAAREACVNLAAGIEAHRMQILDLDGKIAAVGYDEKLFLELSALQPVARQRDALRQSLAGRKKEREEKRRELAPLEQKVQAGVKEAEKATQSGEAAEQRFREKSKDYQAARQKHGSPDAILAVAKDVERLEGWSRQAGELKERIEAQEEQQAALRIQVKALEQEAKAGQAALDKAIQALEHLRQLRSADDLRRHLKEGEPCPVCEQVVAKLPKPGESAAIDQAEQLVEERRKERQLCAQSLVQKRTEMESLPKQIQAMQDNCKHFEESITETLRKAEKVLGAPPGPAGAAELTRLAARIAELESERTAADSERNLAREAESSARRTAQEQSHRLELLRQQLAELEKDIQEKTSNLESLEQQLESWPDSAALQKQLLAQQEAKRKKQSYDQQRKREDEQCRTAEQKLAAAQAEAAALWERVRACETAIDSSSAQILMLEQQLRKTLPDLSSPDQIEKLRAGLEAEARDLSAKIAVGRSGLEALKKQIVEAAEIRARIEDLKTRAALYTELGVALKADQFIGFVLEEALQRLAQDGTRHLLRLSSDRYSFSTHEDDFFVIDHWNAGEKRSVNTLSGGESFLASLALALALAEGLSEFCTDRQTFTLDSLFLDEGFSTLDPETLDVVVQGIEALAGQDRLIGVISHVTELADRLPARIHVTKSPGGSRVG